MNRPALLPSGLVSGLLATLTGVVAAKLALSGAYTAYVRPGMYPFLLAAAAVLVLAGASTAVRAVRATPDGFDDPDDGGHDHGGGRLGVPPVALLLVAPLLLAYLVGHPGLGAATAVDDGGQAPPPSRGVSYAPLQPAPDGVSDIGVLETIQRGLSNDGESLRDHPVRVVGFLTPAGGPAGTVTLSRYAITCCAADAFLASIDLSWPGPPPRASTGQWFAVTAEFAMVERGDPHRPRVLLTVPSGGVAPVAEPADPYET